MGSYQNNLPSGLSGGSASGVSLISPMQAIDQGSSGDIAFVSCGSDEMIEIAILSSFNDMAISNIEILSGSDVIYTGGISNITSGSNICIGGGIANSRGASRTLPPILLGLGKNLTIRTSTPTAQIIFLSYLKRKVK